MHTSTDTAQLESDLGRLLPAGRVSSGSADRVAYARDLWPRAQLLARAGQAAPFAPALVAWPGSVAEVQALVAFARVRQIPLVPFGAGSGVCGGVRPTPDAIVVDVKRMRGMDAIDRAHLTVRADAGILGQHLEDALLAQGMTLGHYPSSISCSTLGGWVAARSAGQCSGRYGKIEDMLVGLTCVDGTGAIHRHRPGDAPDALIPLITGSEGTLAIITDATVRVSPAPAERVFRSATFPATRDGLHAIREIYQRGLRPAVARLYDPFDTFIGGKAREKTHPAKPKARAGDSTPGSTRPGLGTRLLLEAVRRPRGLNRLVELLPASALEGALLVLVWEDDPVIGRAEADAAAEIIAKFGGADAGEGPARRWLSHRHSVSYRQSPVFAGGGFADTMEVAAPWSRLWALHEAVREAVAPHAFVMAHFSHAYPDGGSIYFTFAGAAGSEADVLARYDAAWAGALRAVVTSGGTLSHHHGVGRSKAAFMRDDQGLAVDVVRAMKSILDPSGILNPGALLPEDPPDRAPPAAPTSDTLRPPEPEFRLDRESLLVRAAASASVRHLETWLRGEGFTLGLGPLADDPTVRTWVEAGLPGARERGADPVDQWLAGLEATLGDGRRLEFRPAPRRAVGPDLIGALIGGGGALAQIEAAWFVVRRLTEVTARAYLFGDPAAEPKVRAWLRGRGVRPLRLVTGTRPEGVTLAAVFDSAGACLDAALTVLDEVSRAHGGVPVGVELSRHETAVTRPSPPALLVTTADALRRTSR